MKKHLKLIFTYILVLILIIATTVTGNKVITTISEQSPTLHQNTVVIDAGHGGEDGGATSCTGMLESHINLQIALRLNDLMHLLGINTEMIRTTDTSVYINGNSIAEKKVSDLKERVRLINDIEQCVLISIHQNFFSDCRYSGAQVFYAPTGGSREMAHILQSSFKNAIDPTNNRQIKKADGIYLMQNIHCPAILIECGFISNSEEAVLLQNEDYQKKLCCVIVSGYLAFIKERSL